MPRQPRYGKKNDRGWALSDPIRPPGKVCYLIEVPDTREHRSAFLGAITRLAQSWNWHWSYEEGDTRAAEHAEYWREILFAGGMNIVSCTGGGEIVPVQQIRTVINGNCYDLQEKYDTEPESAWTTIATICNGTDGTDGAPGAPGAPGENCNCEQPAEADSGSVPEPIGETDSPKRCNIAKRVSTSLIDNFFLPLISEYATDVLNGSLTLQQFLINLTAYPDSAIITLIQLLTIVEIGDEAQLINELTQTNRDKIYCHLYCYLPESGDISASVFNQWKTAIENDATLPILLRMQFSKWLFSFGLANTRTEAVIASLGAGNEVCLCNNCPCEGDYVSLYPNGSALIDPDVYKYTPFNTKVGSLYRVTMSGTSKRSPAFFRDWFWQQQTGCPPDVWCSPTGAYDQGWDATRPAYNSDHLYVLEIEGNGNQWGFGIFNSTGSSGWTEGDYKVIVECIGTVQP